MNSRLISGLFSGYNLAGSAALSNNCIKKIRTFIKDSGERDDGNFRMPDRIKAGTSVASKRYQLHIISVYEMNKTNQR